MRKFVNDRKCALDLMVRALALLDKIDETYAAMDLQQAIDTLIGMPESQTSEEIEAKVETLSVRRILKRMDSAVRHANDEK